jgi:hypothetical protein
MSTACTHSPTPSLRDVARSYWNAGLTPIPHVAGIEAPSYIDAHGSVVPLGWGRYKEHQPDHETIARWFGHGDLDTVRIELLTGSAPHSKYEAPARLQILDLESTEVFELFIEQLHFSGDSAILYHCTIEHTPSGGGHIGFLCQAITDQPKLKLAMKTGDTGRDTILIELLQHHLCTVSPTRIAWKPERPHHATYRLTQGSWDRPHTINAEQRKVLLDVARSFNAVPENIVGAEHGPWPHGRPGDVLNEQADRAWWHDLLTRHGWRDVSRPGLLGKSISSFQRPGKVGGTCSATYGKTGIHLYVFSSNAQPFAPDTAYAPFGAYALLEYDGDFGAAAKALATLYGMTSTPASSTVAATRGLRTFSVTGAGGLRTCSVTASQGGVAACQAL